MRKCRYPFFLIKNEDKFSPYSDEVIASLLSEIGISVARRTVSYVNTGDLMATGDRFGMIKFSSRVDHYFPLNAEIQVKVDDEVKAGESIIARFIEEI